MHAGGDAPSMGHALAHPRCLSERAGAAAPQVDAGIAEELVFGDPKAPRFVWWDKKLRPTPSGPDVLTFDLLSIWGKVRAGLGAAGLFKKPLPGARPLSHLPIPCLGPNRVPH